jgi:hypothetical protein
MLQQGQLKVAFKCPSIFKENFEKANCSLTISVGQPNHEGEKLVATLRAINKSFKNCTIMVCDTLQRHTDRIFFPNLDDLAAYIESKKAGDLWLKQNKVYLEVLDAVPRISRWDNWLYHPLFEQQKARMLHAYEQDPGFKKAMQKTIDEFATRLINRLGEDPHILERVYEHSFNYLIEECAIQQIWILESYNFEIYPSERNAILDYTYRKYVQPNHPTLLRPVALKFKRRGSQTKR